MVEDTRIVTGNRSGERDVIRAREHEVAPVHHDAGARSDGTGRRDRRHVFVRFNVITTDNETTLVRTQRARKGRGVALNPEVRGTRLRQGTRTRDCSGNLHILTRVGAARVHHVRTTTRREAAIPSHIRADIRKRTAIVDHDGRAIAHGVTVQDERSPIINGNRLARVLTKVDGGPNRERTRVDDDVTHVRNRCDEVDGDRTRAELRQRVTTHVQEAVVTVTLIVEGEVVWTTDAGVAR